MAPAVSEARRPRKGIFSRAQPRRRPQITDVCSYDNMEEVNKTSVSLGANQFSVLALANCHAKQSFSKYVISIDLLVSPKLEG